MILGQRQDWRFRLPLRPQRLSPDLTWIGPLAIIVVTGVGWLAFRDAVGEEEPVAFALYIGAASIVLMMWSNVLATRVRILEPFFGGLDTMYRWHRWCGAISVVAMWYHVQTIDDVEGIRGASKSVADSAEDLAETGETLLYVLVLVSLIRWVPYRWWRQSHKLMIIPFVFASWHFHTATKPYANSDLWGRWFQFLMLAGIAAWLYRVIWRDVFQRGYRYRIAAVEHTESMTSVEMSPAARVMKYRVGQFIFIKSARWTQSEPHPFTIASHPGESVVRLHIKHLGDWSDALPERFGVGDAVRLEGPYGRLDVFGELDKPVVWIAGGVGITPFLGALRDRRTDSARPHLFYAVRQRSDAPDLDVLLRAHDKGRIVLHLCVSDEGTRVSATDIEQVFIDEKITDAHVVMCGPDSLLRPMTKTVRRLGVKRVHVEAFDIRTGIGPDLSREIRQTTSALRRSLRK